ncbi:methylated-DNA--[protein]-cysteine S-methyltransferase [Massilia sp. PAMC28688]|uniref:methylated-DNA--[protein]-cysteine S-methyltransferase n=1 Tax=Massilia sp. PAMC28688 TaxID=2861283 RepID=UPI001C6351FE|nr:methylated-DNA--[protein]-cysteine S-methyltransferase [Massilia sp. PAMC28688]QYF91680.1 methylated-DNA--[protein]-cysteine S-methyltransferase [Massilia sp. PAMC28688]
MTLDPSSALFSAIVPAPFGAIGIRTATGSLRELVYLPPHFSEQAALDAQAEQAALQVARYLADPDFVFTLAVPEVGSAFQRTVWRAIAAIPRGTVRTYGQVASAIGSAPRAVGQACGANWFPLLVPCHRVTAAGGLGGFASHDDEHGFHLSVKRWLLKHEGVSNTPWQQQSIFA